TQVEVVIAGFRDRDLRRVLCCDHPWLDASGLCYPGARAIIGLQYRPWALKQVIQNRTGEGKK
ncbi:hypothetical protein ACFL59_11735, partial [Planctomycetota bacterium]